LDKLLVVCKNEWQARGRHKRQTKPSRAFMSSPMTPVEQLAQQALALAPADRAYLADVLEQSLSTGSFATPELAALWADEIDRRLAAYERGEAKPTDADIALQRSEQRLVAHRARKSSS
jgi:hypothetical protein